MKLFVLLTIFVAILAISYCEEEYEEAETAEPEPEPEPKPPTTTSKKPPPPTTTSKKPPPPPPPPGKPCKLFGVPVIGTVCKGYCLIPAVGNCPQGQNCCALARQHG